MKSKRVWAAFGAGITAIAILFVIVMTLGGSTEGKEDTSVLLGMDVTDLSKAGAGLTGSSGDSAIYGRLPAEGEPFSISGCEPEPSAEWLYWFETCYKGEGGGKSALYRGLNQAQLAADGLAVDYETMVDYLDSLFPEEGGCFCKMAEYESNDGWMVVSIRYAPPAEGSSSRCRLYNYEKALNVRFTVWHDEDGKLLYVPYSIMEGVPQELWSICGGTHVMPVEYEEEDVTAGTEE